MQSFSAYLPIDRRQQLVTAEPIPDGQIEGCALFVDISGFSKLTARLQSMMGERRGVESLTHYLNQIYELIVVEIHRYQGVIIGFSGDAVTCWFREDDGLRAVACALDIQDRFRQDGTIVLPGGEQIVISVKAAVSVGRARRFTVGLEAYGLNEVLAGGIIDRMSDAEQLAESGEIVATPKTIEQLEGRIAYARLIDHDGLRFGVIDRLMVDVAAEPWPDRYELSAEATRPWIIDPIYERIEAGQENYIAELRSVVSMFLSFRGIDYEDEGAVSKLDQLVSEVQQILGRYFGYLTQLTMGDKGGYLLAVFGSPIAIENPAENAGRSALEIHQLIETLPFLESLHIGISKGRARSGAYGASMRRSYGTMGHQVNMSARLMVLAKPGQTVVSDFIFSDTESVFEFDSLGQHLLKGAAQPVELYALNGLRLTRQIDQEPPAVLLGREEESTLIQERLTQLIDGERTRSMMILEGEAGIGKTRLLEHARQLAQETEIAIVSVSGNATARNSPYFVWQQVLPALIEGEDGPILGQEEMRSVLLQRIESIDPEMVPLAPVLNAIFPLDFQETPLSEQLGGEVRANLIRRLFVALVSQLTDGGSLLLIVDDGHYLDSASWAVLRELQQRLDRALILFATRPLSPPLPAEYPLIRDDEGVILLQLDTLPAEAILDLVCHRLETDVLPAVVEDLLLSKAEGNPYFAEELAYALRDGEFIEVVDGDCRLTTDVESFQRLSFPNTVQDVITSRFDHLNPQEQLAVKVASVIGRIFTFQILREVHPIDAHKSILAEILSQLERIDITPLESADPELTYIFKHIITQEVIYDLLLFSQKQELHQLIAEWYETAYADRLASQYALLAFHWQQTEVREKKIYYLEKAGEQALKTYASREAAVYFEALLALESPDALPEKDGSGRLRVARWKRQLGQAYNNMGEITKSYEALSEAADLLGYPEPAKSGTLTRQTAGQFGRQLLQRRFPGRARTDDPAEAAVFAEAARIYYLLSLSYNYNAGVLEPVYALLLSLNLAERAAGHLDITNELSRGYAGVGASYLIALRNRRVADAYFEKARGIARSENDIEALAWSYLLESLVKLLTGYIDESEALAAKAHETYTRISDYVLAGQSLSVIGTGHGYRGDFKSSLQAAEEKYLIGRMRNNPELLASSLDRMGNVKLLFGRVNEAAANLIEAQKLTEEHQVEVNRGIPECHLAGVRLFEGDEAGAWGALKAAKPLIFQIPENLNASWALFTWLHTMITLLDQNSAAINRSEALALADEMLAYCKRTFRQKSPILLTRFAVYEGWYHALTGNSRRATRIWRTALKKAEAAGMRPDVALLLERLALIGAGSDHETQLNRARAMFEEMGLVFFTTLADRRSTLNEG